MTDKQDLDQSELEAEFQTLVSDVSVQMDLHVQAAKAELKKAIDISEKYGVPFDPGICSLSNPYVPHSFGRSKFVKLDEDAISDITGVYSDYFFEGGGWEHSSIC